MSCRYIRNQINAGAVKREVPLTTIEKAALDFLDEQTRRADLRLDMDLQAGDIQFINNYTILHSRTGFVDGPEPHQKRHMLRLWLKFPTTWPLERRVPHAHGLQARAGHPDPHRSGGVSAMPKVLTEAQVATFQRDGCLSPVRAMSAERAARLPRAVRGARGARARHQEDEDQVAPALPVGAGDRRGPAHPRHLRGPDRPQHPLLEHGVAREEGRRRDLRRLAPGLGLRRGRRRSCSAALALSDCGVTQGCLRGVPGSHKWGILKHEESDDPKSILARGQFITDGFDESKAVDFALEPGEMVMFDNSLVHGSGTNFGPDRRFLLLVEMLPTWAKPPRVRQSAMLMRGRRTPTATSTTSRGPDGEWTETALANWSSDRRQARHADLRGQQDRPERGLRRGAAGNVAP